MSAPRLRAALFASVICLAPRAQAQCLEWSRSFGTPANGLGPIGKEVLELASIDLGSGPKLIAAGNFHDDDYFEPACVAQWQGTEWTALGAGFFGGSFTGSSGIRALAVYDDGSGAALYGGGTFTYADGSSGYSLARWDGTHWHPVPRMLDGYVNDLAVYDDGSGPALYIAGYFFNPTSVPYTVMRFDGSSVVPIAFSSTAQSLSLAVFDDGSGSALYIGKEYTDHHLYRWNGTAMNTVPGGPGGVAAMRVFDDGSGPALYVAGQFLQSSGAPANGVARWNGTSWSGLGLNGSFYDLRALAAFDDGAGVKLYAGGRFGVAGGAVYGVERFDGSQWTLLGSGANEQVDALTVHDDGHGPRLVAGGRFSQMDGQIAPCVSTWDGAHWGPYTHPQGMFGGIAPPSGTSVSAMRVFDDGHGQRLWVGGDFGIAGDTLARGLARFDGQSWSPAGDPNGAVTCFGVYDAGSGPELVVGGAFTQIGAVAAQHIARWDGAQWHPLGNGLQLPGPIQVNALAVFDAGGGPELYAGGYFTFAGTQSVFHIARWNGTSWSAVGSGANGPVRALAVYDDGSGPALYCGGNFPGMGSTPAPGIARWDGVSWSDVGGGVAPLDTTGVRALGVFDFGSGPQLVAAGNFSSAGGVSAHLVARWNGAQWSALGSLTGQSLEALATLDDGSGAALYAGGSFALPAGNLARWSGTQWTPLGSGVSGFVGALATMATMATGGAARDLYVGGTFAFAGGHSSRNLARWEGCGSAGALFCFGDGTAAQPCPCANAGAPGHGCENSAGTAGALLSASGSTSPDLLTLSAQGELPSALSIFLQGDVAIAATNFGDGLRCAGGNLRRLYAKNAVAGLASAPGPGELAVSLRSAQLGDALAPGALRFYQTYYRDPSASFCANPPGNTWNVTNGVRVQW